MDSRSIQLARLGTGVFGGMAGQGGRLNYGGEQLWFEQDWQRNSCCGVVAAANIMAYMADTQAAYRPLYTQPRMDQECFALHQEQLLQCLRPPRIWLPGRKGRVTPGIFTLGRFKRGALKYAGQQGVQLKAVSRQKWLNRKGKTLDWIYASLAEDRPVAMLVHFNSSLKKHESGQCFQLHWVTITGMQNVDGRRLVTVSSWRREYILDLDTAWDKSSYIGFVYFK